MTLVSETRVPEDVWAEAEGVLGKRMLANALMAVVAVNAWNRIAVAARMASRYVTR